MNKLRHLTRAALLLLLLLPPAITLSQPEFFFSGYVVDIPSYQRLNATLATLGQMRQDQFYNLTRVRLRPELIPWKDGNLSVEYEITGLYQSSPYGLFADAENGRNQLVDMSWTLVVGTQYATRHFVDRLNFKQILDAGEIVVGRQRISMGTGRIWNPTDLFNPINPANFAKIEKDGVDAVAGRIYLGDLSDFSFVYNPYDDFRKQNIGAKIRSNIAEYDFSFLLGRFEDRNVLGMDFAGNLCDAGVRGEGIYSSHKKDDLQDGFLSFILGIDNQFTPELYALIEYHYNGEGRTDKREYEVNRLIEGRILNLSTQYLGTTLSYLVHPLVTCSALSIANLIDGSGFVMLTATYSLSDEAALTAGGQLTYGSDLTEYWYYPTSGYLQIEYHF